MDIQFSGEEATKDPVTGATLSPQFPSVFPQSMYLGLGTRGMRLVLIHIRTDRTDRTHTVKCRRSDKSSKKMDLMTLIQENPPQKPRAVSPDWHNPGPTERVQYYTSVSLTRSLPTFLCQSQFSALAWFWFHSKFDSLVSN
jgi:hypothetical protein